MFETTLLVACLMAIAGAFIAGRFLFRHEPKGLSDALRASELTVARLEERETSLNSQLKDANERIDATNGQLNDQMSELNSFRERNAAADSLVSELKGQIDRAGVHISDRDSLIASLRDQLETARAETAQKDVTIASGSERETALGQKLADKDRQLTEMQANLRIEFENIANKILGNSSTQLSEKSKELLSPLLEPLRDKIVEFQTRMENVHVEQTSQRSTLQEQIRQVTEAGFSIGKQAEGLVKALKGDSQLRG